MSKTFNAKVRKAPKQRINTIEVGKNFYFVADDHVCNTLKCQKGMILMAKLLQTEEKDEKNGMILCEIVRVSAQLLVPVNTSVISFEKVQGCISDFHQRYILSLFSD